MPETRLPESFQSEPRLRRSLMLTPGNRGERLAKAVTLPSDCVVFDLEDGVPPTEKDRARRAVADALLSLDFGGRERCVRINGTETADIARDLESLPLDRLDSLMIPKVESAGGLRRFDVRLAAAERRAGRTTPVDLIVSIETPKGLLKATEIAEASPRATALFFGSGDFTAITGGAVTADALLHPRSVMVVAAAAAGLQAIDAAYFAAVKDAEATRRDALAARSLGFCGKLVFHPVQVDVANEVFAPTEAEVARARRIVQAYRDSLERGHGTAVVDGIFIAVDMLPPAERTLRIARQVAGRLEKGIAAKGIANV